MPGHFLSAVLAGVALLQGAESNEVETPLTVEAAPAETPPPVTPPAPSADPAPLPEIDLPAHEFQGEPAPPQTVGEPKTEEAPPAPEATAGESDTAKPISEELIRPTEKKDRSGQKVVAFWFITTGR